MSTGPPATPRRFPRRSASSRIPESGRAMRPPTVSEYGHERVGRPSARWRDTHVQSVTIMSTAPPCSATVVAFVDASGTTWRSSSLARGQAMSLSDVDSQPTVPNLSTPTRTRAGAAVARGRHGDQGQEWRPARVTRPGRGAVVALRRVTGVPARSPRHRRTIADSRPFDRDVPRHGEARRSGMRPGHRQRPRDLAGRTFRSARGQRRGLPRSRPRGAPCLASTRRDGRREAEDQAVGASPGPPRSRRTAAPPPLPAAAASRETRVASTPVTSATAWRPVCTGGTPQRVPPQIPPRRRDQRLQTLAVRHAHPPQVAGEVPLDDEVGQHRLVERRRVLIGGRPRRHQTLPGDPAARSGSRGAAPGNSVLLKVPT